MKDLRVSLTRTILLSIIFVLMLSFSLYSVADQLVPVADSDSLALFELLTVAVGGERAAQFLSVLGLVCYLGTHIIAWLPPHLITLLPAWLIRLLEYLAGNYRGTKNETNSTINGGHSVN